MTPLTTPEQTLLDAAFQIARGEFDQNGEAAPLLLAIRGDGQLGVVPLAGCPKNQIGGIVERIKAVAPCALILEVWLSHVTKEAMPANFEASQGGDTTMLIPPRLDPARKEAVCVQLFSKERHILTHAVITRPQEGKPTLGEWGNRFDNADESTGKTYRTSFECPDNARLTSGNV